MFFKSRELIALLVLGAFLSTLATAALVRDYIINGGHRVPKLTATAFFLAEVPEKLYEFTTSIGSSPLEIDDRFPEQSGFVGETDEDERYLLLNRFDGDLERSVVDLIDLRSFQILHRWEPIFEPSEFGRNHSDQNFGEIYPFYSDVLKNKATHSELTPRGGLVVGREGHIGKFNACSNLLWHASLAKSIPTNASLETDGRGYIWVTTAQSRTPRSRYDLHPGSRGIRGARYIDNSIVQLDPSGEAIFTKSVTDILIENRLSQVVFRYALPPTPDYFHLVDIEPALNDGTHWQKGDVLISLKHLSMVLLYRPSTDTVLWHSKGQTDFQSDVGFVGDSRIVMFDNNTPNYLQQNGLFRKQEDREFKVVNGHSKVLVYDFETNQYSHYLDESLLTNKLKTAYGGRSQILLNGDLFVEETEFGRLLYLSSDGSLLWSHVNRAEDNEVYATGSSRILYRDHEIAKVQDFLAQKDQLLADCK